MQVTQRFHALCCPRFKTQHLIWILLAWFATGASQTYADVDTAWDAERTLYKKARQALSKRQISQFYTYQATLIDYSLYSYLVHGELVARLANVSDEEVDAFLTTFTDGPLANRMRLTWLFQLQKKVVGRVF